MNPETEYLMPYINYGLAMTTQILGYGWTFRMTLQKKRLGIFVMGFCCEELASRPFWVLLPKMQARKFSTKTFWLPKRPPIANLFNI